MNISAFETAPLRGYGSNPRIAIKPGWTRKYRAVKLNSGFLPALLSISIVSTH
jgi:hypothetical protein